MNPLAAAALPLVFGLQLGSPISLPECERIILERSSPDGSAAPHTALPSEECFEHGLAFRGDIAGRGDGVDYGTIYFPAETVPAIVRRQNIGGALVGGTLIGGTLQSLEAETLDYQHADYIIAQLTNKFGKPDSDIPETVQLNSIAVPSRRAIWQKAGYRVEYDSVSLQSVGHGVLLIQSDAAVALFRRNQDLAKSKHSPL